MPAVVEVGGVGLWALLRVTRPLGYRLYDRVTPLLGEGDQEVFVSEGMREMFIGDLQNGSRKQFRAALHNASLFGRDGVPARRRVGAGALVARRHRSDRATVGGGDRVPAPAGRRVPRAPGRAHLGGFAAAQEVLEVLVELRRDPAPAARQNGNGRSVRSLTE